MNMRRALNNAAFIRGARLVSFVSVCLGGPELARAQDARAGSEENPSGAPKTGEIEPPVGVPRAPVTPPEVTPEPAQPAEPQTPLDAQPAPTAEMGTPVPAASDLPPEGLPVIGAKCTAGRAASTPKYLPI